MSRKILFPLLALSLIAALPAAAVEVRVSIENLAPENGNFLTPVWVGFHNGQFDSYDSGAPLRESIERIAEDGNTGPLTAEFDAEFGTPQATILGPGGPIAPGETASFRFNLDGSAAVRYFSYVSMIIPSNDAFIANGPPTAHRVFDTSGEFTPVSFIVYGIGGVNDGGTEVNDEIPANTAFFGQAAPDTGVVEGGVVTTHPGFLPAGSGGILDDPRFAAATFERPGYQIARISVEAVRGTEIAFGASAAQEVPTNGSTAIAACEGRLNADRNAFELECNHEVDDASAAHIHIGAPGENGPVVFDLGDPASPIRATWTDLTQADVDALLTGGLYVNIHSPTYPGGEIRGQIAGCFAGPDSLCLNDQRFQVEVDWQTAGENGIGKSIEVREDTGLFYFFSEPNIELAVKVLDGCDINGYYWVFAGGLTDQGVDITVTDTLTGQVQTYSNELGTAFEPIRDTSAFATCP